MLNGFLPVADSGKKIFPKNAGFLDVMNATFNPRNSSKITRRQCRYSIHAFRHFIYVSYIIGFVFMAHKILKYVLFYF